jgi:DNA end-binding protein Ku
VPSDSVGQEAFAVIRDAMKGKGMVALGRIVVSKRERVIALEPYDKGLIGTTLHYPYEVRNSVDYFDEIPDVKVQDEMLKLAEHILATKTGDFDPAQFKDRYEEAVVELIRKKRENIPVKTEKEAPAAPNVINLMDALRRSVQQAGAAPPPAEAKKGKRRVEGQKEMLLPIEGKKPAREAAKRPTRAGAKQRKAG